MPYGAPLPAGFYDRDPAVVARELLGAVLRHENELGAISGRIVETEAYLGPHDPASHSAVGRTARTWHTFARRAPVVDELVLVGPRVRISKAVEWPMRFLVRSRE